MTVRSSRKTSRKTYLVFLLLPMIALVMYTYTYTAIYSKRSEYPVVLVSLMYGPNNQVLNFQEYIQRLSGHQLIMMVPKLFEHHSSGAFGTLPLTKVFDVRKTESFVFVNSIPFENPTCTIICDNRRDNFEFYVNRTMAAFDVQCRNIEWKIVDWVSITENISSRRNHIHILGGYYRVEESIANEVQFVIGQASKPLYARQTVSRYERVLEMRKPLVTVLGNESVAYNLFHLRLPDFYDESATPEKSICVGYHECDYHINQEELIRLFTLNFTVNATAVIMTNRPELLILMTRNIGLNLITRACSPLKGLQELFCEMQLAYGADYFVADPRSSVMINVALTAKPSLKIYSIKSFLNGTSLN